MMPSMPPVSGAGWPTGPDVTTGRSLGTGAPRTAGDLLQHARSARSSDAIRATAVEFEAMFLGEMFRHMWAGLDVDPVFGGGSGEKMFRGMLIDEMSQEIARNRGIGIADMVEKELLRVQESRS